MVVLYWHDVALRAVQLDFETGGTLKDQAGPARTSRALAIIMLAVHDAVAAVLSPAAAYAVKALGAPAAPAPAGAGLGDVVAGAAETAIIALYPHRLPDLNRSSPPHPAS